MRFPRIYLQYDKTKYILIKINILSCLSCLSEIRVMKLLHVLIGPREKDLQTQLKEVELMRFAKYWECAKDGYYHMAYELGLEAEMIDKIEHDFCSDLVMKTFAILTTWMEISDRRNCETLLNAANRITGTDHKHTLCRVSFMSYYA